MKRIAAVLATSVVLLLGSAGVAHADNDSPPMAGGCGGGYVGEALGKHLQYRFQAWDVGSEPDEGRLGIDAPRGWSFVRTPQAEGRFHSRDGNVLLSLRELTRAATPEAAMSEQVRALAGTPGLKLIGQHVRVIDSLDQRWATLTYHWSSMGEPRTVKQRWIAYGTDPSNRAILVVTVAGRALDGKGLDALLAHVSPTASIAG
jgi:hypothetical protein